MGSPKSWTQGRTQGQAVPLSAISTYTDRAWAQAGHELFCTFEPSLKAIDHPEMPENRVSKHVQLDSTRKACPQHSCALPMPLLSIPAQTTFAISHDGKM